MNSREGSVIHDCTCTRTSEGPVLKDHLEVRFPASLCGGLHLPLLTYDIFFKVKGIGFSFQIEEVFSYHRCTYFQCFVEQISYRDKPESTFLRVLTRNLNIG